MLNNKCVNGKYRRGQGGQICIQIAEDVLKAGDNPKNHNQRDDDKKYRHEGWVGQQSFNFALKFIRGFHVVCQLVECFR